MKKGVFEMKALFRNARVYENGSINIRDILFDGASVSSFDGDASAIPSFLVFDNIFLPCFYELNFGIVRDIF